MTGIPSLATASCRKTEDHLSSIKQSVDSSIPNHYHEINSMPVKQKFMPKITAVTFIILTAIGVMCGLFILYSHSIKKVLAASDDSIYDFPYNCCYQGVYDVTYGGSDPSYNSNYMGPYVIDGRIYDSSYYSQATYYSQAGYYAQGYYQGYYQAGYYAQGYYQAGYYAQGYYQGAYEGAYYTQGFYQGAYVSPDLVGSMVQPSNTTVGTPITFTGIVLNSNITTAARSSSALYCLGGVNCTGGAIVIGTHLVGPLGPSGFSGALTTSWTPTVAGPYSISLCADYPLPGVVGESNEGNNCHTWPFNVTTPDVALAAQGSFIAKGGFSLLRDTGDPNTSSEVFIERPDFFLTILNTGPDPATVPSVIRDLLLFTNYSWREVEP